MSKSSVNRYFADFQDDGVCLSSTNISTKSFTRKRSSCEFQPKTSQTCPGSRRNEYLNRNLPMNLSSNQIQKPQRGQYKPIILDRKFLKKPQIYESNITEHEKKYNRVVSSDVESDTESLVDESTLDSTEEPIKHDDTKCGQWCLICSQGIDSRKLSYRIRFKLIVTGLKLLQVVLSLLWTLITYLEPHLNRWVQGRFKWISYICLGLYFFLYCTVRFGGCLHGYWKLVTIFVFFTLSFAHVTAVTSISTGSLMMPVALGLILFIGLNYFFVTCRTSEKDDCCMSLYRFGVAVFITLCLAGMITSIYMGSLHVDKGTSFNKAMASAHCALVIGLFYGVYIIYEIRMFLEGKRLVLDGVRDDYMLAAVAI